MTDNVIKFAQLQDPNRIYETYAMERPTFNAQKKLLVPELLNTSDNNYEITEFEWEDQLLMCAEDTVLLWPKSGKLIKFGLSWEIVEGQPGYLITPLRHGVGSRVDFVKFNNPTKRDVRVTTLNKKGFILDFPIIPRGSKYIGFVDDQQQELKLLLLYRMGERITEGKRQALRKTEYETFAGVPYKVSVYPIPLFPQYTRRLDITSLGIVYDAHGFWHVGALFEAPWKLLFVAPHQNKVICLHLKDLKDFVDNPYPGKLRWRQEKTYSMIKGYPVRFAVYSTPEKDYIYIMAKDLFSSTRRVLVLRYVVSDDAYERIEPISKPKERKQRCRG